MIDAHVHTFPALLPAGDKLRRAAARLPARGLLDIEGAHALRIGSAVCIGLSRRRRRSPWCRR